MRPAVIAPEGSITITDYIEIEQQKRSQKGRPVGNMTGRTIYRANDTQGDELRRTGYGGERGG